MIILGVTGPFASGKSLACDYLRSIGFFEIDADKIGKEALLELKDKIVNEFGNSIIENNEINPKKLGNIVFEDEKMMERLNSIVHPFIKGRVRDIIDKNKDKDIVINAAIMFKIGLNEFVDRIITIFADEETLINRGQERNGFSRERILKIINMQKKYNDYLNQADYIIMNNSSKEKFLKKMDKIVRRLQNDNRG
ncbi:MAG TPA: dephospho-CoA kinase [Spirochaetota bacterium]|nr:dephospho-CoA kinase [Spirochaetota bacterium]HOM38928.1 dephospho-CoA kinase [Spirochaetota bacterium]HPQ49184.1 dephospho-CoA kinase [Spirochaetota bacterium]